MTHEEFIDLLKEWGLSYVSNSRGGVPWYEHNRNSKGQWGPVHGIGNHHTGGGDDLPGASVLWYGYNSLPGPLCHAGIRQDGTILLNGWGRVNHFGLGDDDTLTAVKNENYTGVLKPNEANTDGNRHFYGFEWMYDGLSDPSVRYPKLYRTAVRLNAAICTHHEWKAESSIGHGEWQPGKWDPGHAKGKMMPMDQFRNHVEQAIHEGPKPKLPTRNPTYTVKEGDTLRSIAESKLGGAGQYINLVALNPSVIRPLEVGEVLKLPKG